MRKGSPISKPRIRDYAMYDCYKFGVDMIGVMDIQVDSFSYADSKFYYEMLPLRMVLYFL